MKLTVVTICRNNLEGLRLTRESVAGQTWRDFEWIVIDGNSDDGTREYLAGLDPQPDCWISEKDSGVYDAMNKGLARANGEYVLFLNSGDAFAAPESLEKLMTPESSADIIYGDLNLVSNDGMKKAPYPSVLDQENLILDGLPHPASAIRTALLKGAGGYDASYRIVADFKFFMQAFKEGRTFVHRRETVTDFALGGLSCGGAANLGAERQRAIREVFGVDDAGADYAASKVVVAVPVYRQRPSAAEALSLKRSFSVLRDYEIALCCPDGLDVSEYDGLAGFELRKERFAAHFFDGIEGYNRLMVDPGFYMRFAAFEYLLVCQPDAWIFRDELRQWCAKGYEYIGAPLFTGCSTHETGGRLEATCNGGLSLRKVDRFLEITRSGEPRRIMVQTGGYNEDYVFSVSLRSTPYELKSPLPIEAAQFSFERSPKYLFELTGYRLPFGCHAWAKYDFYGFWSRYIPYRLSGEEIGYALEAKDIELEVARQRLDELRARAVADDPGDSPGTVQEPPAPGKGEVAVKWLRGLAKQFVPYGAMCMWLRSRYGVEIERPLFHYGIGTKGMKRIVKFMLPYGLVMKWREDVYREPNLGCGSLTCGDLIVKSEGGR